MKDERPYPFFRAYVSPWGLITAAGAITCIASLLGFFGRFSWIMDLFSHFRVQYLLSLTVAALLLFAGGKRKIAYIYAAFALLNFLPITPYVFPDRVQPTQSQTSMRAIMLNVNSSTGNPMLVTDFIKANNPDVIVLEEISKEWQKNLKAVLANYPHRIERPRPDNFGIGLYSRIPLINPRILTIGSANLPSVIAEFRHEETNITILATHPLPPGGSEYTRRRNEQLNMIAEYVSRIQTPVILVGDLNTTPWSYHFKRMEKTSGLTDSSRTHGIQTTWPSMNQLMRIPLDHCLHSEDVIITKKRIGSKTGSDHYPLIIDFVLKL